jgi:hypothetical protein
MLQHENQLESMSSEKIGQADPFASILAGTGAHREKHGCWAYPFVNGPLLGVMAATKERPAASLNSAPPLAIRLSGSPIARKKHRLTLSIRIGNTCAWRKRMSIKLALVTASGSIRAVFLRFREHFRRATTSHPENPQATEKIVKPTRAKNNERNRKNNTIPDANRNP